MNGIMNLKIQLQGIYAKYSKYIDKAVQFVLAIAAFTMINQNLGYMKLLTNPVIAFGMAVVCAFLPPVVTVLAAAVLILAHAYSASLGIMAIVAVLFLMMFIFYLRLAPKTAIVVLLTPLAFLLKIPAAIPVAVALVGTPVYAVPAAFGTMVYYIIRQINTSASAIQAAEDSSLVTDTIDFAQQVLAGKEMWLFVIAMILCTLVVYAVRRAAMAHAWKAASVVGAAAYLIVAAVGSSVLDVKVSYGSLFLGAIVAVILGVVLEAVFFAVDYSKCESLQYEDDKYYYYVKAVPKVGLPAEETEPAEEIKRPKKAGQTKNQKQSSTAKKQGAAKGNKKPEPAKEEKNPGPSENTDHLLLTRSLRKDLNLDEEDQ